MADKVEEDLMTDDTLDNILAFATKPQVQGFEQRLAARIKAEPRSSNIIDFPQSKKPKLGWIFGLPLAASLMLGLWLGTTSQGTDIFPLTLTASTQTSDATPASGIEDIEALNAGDLS